MKTVEQIKPTYAAVYAAALYPDLCKLFQKHGYALAVHGSLARDFDLIAVPWAETVTDHQTVLRELLATYAFHLLDELDKPDVRNHGRLAYTISVGFGECAVDISFFNPCPSVSIRGSK